MSRRRVKALRFVGFASAAALLWQLPGGGAEPETAAPLPFAKRSVRTIAAPQTPPGPRRRRPPLGERRSTHVDILDLIFSPQHGEPALDIVASSQLGEPALDIIPSSQLGEPALETVFDAAATPGPGPADPIAELLTGNDLRSGSARATWASLRGQPGPAPREVIARVPEPGSGWLLVTGLAALAVGRRSRARVPAKPDSRSHRG
jgi:hypothetical protein